ncbi:MAG: hypothetical protein H7Y03_08850 [Chitinophagaceae bacterium]|nr:hypothetical protein [Chitinophagaceae bacterium]
MAQQKIELRRLRDFGENLNDTFQFIRLNFKPLLATFFAICGVFMVTMAIFSGLYQSNTMSRLESIVSGAALQDGGFLQIFGIGYFLLLLSMWLTYVMMQVTVTAYIKFYVENDGATPSIENVWDIVKRYFFKVLLYSIPIVLLQLVGFVFCVLPGIWLGVVMIPFVSVVIIEDQNFSSAFNRCFEIIKENFWTSLLLYFVALLIYSFMSNVIGLIVGGIVGFTAYFTTKDIGTTLGVVTSLFNMFSLTFYLVFLVSAALHYFNLVEKRDGTGLLSRIEGIGNTDKNHDNTEEEY